MNKLQHAKHLVSIGFSVFPLVKDSKQPAVKWKEFQTRKPTEAELTHWFGVHDFDIAIVTGLISGIVVIDCDNSEAQTKAAEHKLASPIAQTTKRGCHYIHKFNGERNSTGLFGVAGIDQRGEGGYIKAYNGSKYWNLDLLYPISEQVKIKSKTGPSAPKRAIRRDSPKTCKFIIARIVDGKPQEPDIWSLDALPSDLSKAIRCEPDHAFTITVNANTYAVTRCY